MPTHVLPTLLFGSRGDNVRKLQGYLRQLGQQLAIDGVFGPETRQAVLNFQAQAGVAPLDGIVGPLTWEAIEINLGMNVDVGEDGPAPQAPGGEDPVLTPTKLIAGGLIGAGLLAILLG